MTKRNSNHKELIAALGTVLADTYVLAVKTHGYHWNVTGTDFPQLHDFFDREYTALIAAADEIAERIRALGALAPAGMTQLLQLAEVKDAGGKALSAKEMLADLATAHEVAVAGITAARKLAGLADDVVTDDLLIGRNAAHDKTLWMLKAQLA